MESVKIPVLKSPYLSLLKDQVKKDGVTSPYRSKAGFKLDPDGLFLETMIKSAGPLPALQVPSSGALSASDAGNAVELHKVFPKLSPAIASDQRLWAWMTHGEYFSYCKNRWPVNGKKQSTDRNLILTRWFFSKGIQRNAIARLWWAAHLTHAPWDVEPRLERFRKSDPYHYTPVILMNQDIYQGLLERDFGRSLILRIVILDVLDGLKTSSSAFTTLVTKFMLGVNFLMKHTDLESIPVDTLHARLLALAGRISKG